MQSGLKNVIWIALTPFLAWCFSISGMALDLPAKPFSRLGSEDFGDREAAQAEILAWARKHSEPAVEELFRQSRVAENPETRERCVAVLRELVNDEYLMEGEGYLGIRMQDERANVPGDKVPRAVIRVIEVVQDSAADEAGLEVNDLIVGLNNQIWKDGDASLPFMEKIRELKPNALIFLDVLRDDKIVKLEVKLGRRPLFADHPLMNNADIDLGAAERAAKDAYFRRWMSRRKSGN